MQATKAGRLYSKIEAIDCFAQIYVGISVFKPSIYWGKPSQEASERWTSEVVA